MQAEVDQDMRERLERFLSWLLDARWFPETDAQEKTRLKGELRGIRRILARMQAYSERIPDARLQRGLAEWRRYESNLAASAKLPRRRAPHFRIDDSSTKGSPEIAKRLMCAFLIIRKLRPKVGAYQEIQRLLADPSQLPCPIAVSEKTIRELQAGTLRRPGTPSELHYQREGRDIPMRPYWRSVKALESSVARLERGLKADKRSDQLKILHDLYFEYLLTQKFQAGFSNDEAAMLNALVSTDVPAVAGVGVQKGPNT